MDGMNRELEELKAENQKLRRELEAQKKAVLHQTTEITKRMIAEARKLVEELIRKRLG